MTTIPSLDEYRAHLEARGSSRHTIRGYCRDLGGVLAELREVTAPALLEALTSTRVTRCPDGVTPKSPAAQNRCRAAVRAFFGWAESTGRLDVNPARHVRLQRVTRTPPAFLTDAEVRRLRKALTGRTGEQSKRDRVLIEVFLGTGIRLQELVELNVEDVDLDSKHLHIRKAKGGQPQVKFLNTAVRGLLRAYLAVRKRQGVDTCPALFLSQRGTRLSPRQVENRLQAWLEDAGIDKPITPHSLRHTFATRLYQRSGDLLVVQRALGHRQLATTEIYTHLVDAQLEDAIERL